MAATHFSRARFGIAESRFLFTEPEVKSKTSKPDTGATGAMTGELT